MQSPAVTPVPRAESKRRLKVFYFIPNLAMGGPERQLLLLIQSLPARFEPVLCLYHDSVFFRRELPEDQPRYVIGSPRMGLRGLARLVSILRREQPDILHSYRDKANFWARLAALRAGVPVIISSCRNRAMQLRYLAVERLLSDRCDVVLTNSEGVKHELVSWARVEPERIRVIHNILELDLFRPPTAAERRAARQQWGLAAGQRALLLPGRIGLQKHQVGLLLALDRLARSGGLPPEVVVLLAGRRRDLRVARWVDRIMERPALRDRVRFLDAQTDVRSLYWASDLLVMPSLYEGLSNAALEGCACGLPAILSHAANVDQIVVSGATGLEVPTGDGAALARALEATLALSDDGLRELGRRGREHVARRFAPTPSHVVDRTVAIYDELLARAGVTAVPG